MRKIDNFPTGYKNCILINFHRRLGKKWAEAKGQSSYYSLQTGKKPGVVLILEDLKDRKYWIRLNSTIEYFGLPIDIWSIGSEAH